MSNEPTMNEPTVSITPAQLNQMIGVALNIGRDLGEHPEKVQNLTLSDVFKMASEAVGD